MQNKAPKPKHAPKHQRGGADANQEAGAGRVVVRIRSFSRRVRDVDAQVVKYHLDGLRYAGLIPDDTPEAITLTVEPEQKVGSKAEERTEIEIEVEEQ